MDPEIVDFYENLYDESARLFRGRNNLERVRTMDVLQRFMPAGRLRIADVGGGPGVYAQWLAKAGHDVHLFDPVPRHVSAAGSLDVGGGSIKAELGDAGSVNAPDDSFDVVLLLGPLYHLLERRERVQVWVEARRVCRPGGLIVGGVISRFSSFQDMLVRGRLAEPGIAEFVVEDLATGRHRNVRKGESLFTTAYFHHPEEVLAEVQDAGIELDRLIGLEGAGGLVVDIEEQLNDETKRPIILDILRGLEEEPSLLGLSGHLLALATAS